MMRLRPTPLLVALALALAGLAAPAPAQTPKPGGVLAIAQREDLPQGFAIHETSTISVVWPAMPCFSNLVLFDPMKKVESADTIIGELAEKWSWQDPNATSSFSSGRTSGGTTASPSRRRTPSTRST